MSGEWPFDEPLEKILDLDTWTETTETHAVLSCRNERSPVSRQMTRLQFERRTAMGYAGIGEDGVARSLHYDPEHGTVSVPVEIVETPSWLETWYGLGMQNPWIREASDPPFDYDSFAPVASVTELEERLLRGGCWSVGVAFYLGDICFINQSEGGDEWLVIKQDTAFESFSGIPMIKSGRLAEAVECIQRATTEQCRALEYTSTGMRAHVYSNGYHYVLQVRATDLEELIVRCGWTVCDQIEGWTEAGRAELTRLEGKPYVESRFKTDEAEAARGWWLERELTREPALTPNL